MTDIEYTEHPVAHTLQEQLEHIKLIRQVEEAIDKKRREHGSHVERTPVDFDGTDEGYGT